MARLPDITEVVSEQTLQLLSCPDSFVSIPCINIAAKIALRIFSMTQKAKSNRKKFIALGEEMCQMMTDIIRKVNAAEQPDSQANMTSLQEDCRDLLLVVEGIETRVEKRMNRQFLGRVLGSRSDASAIEDCRALLKDALDKFTVCSQIEVRKGVDDINDKLDRLTGRVNDTQQTTNQYVGGSAYSCNEDNSVAITGTGNSVNVSVLRPAPQSIPHQMCMPLQPCFPYSQPQNISQQPHFSYIPAYYSYPQQ